MLPETRNIGNSPLAKTLEAIKNKDDKIVHNLKVLLGMLTNDTIGASMELGRLGGVLIFLELAKDQSVDLKLRYLCLHCLSCAGSHPTFCRIFIKEEIQDQLPLMIIKSSYVPEEVDLVIGAMTIYLRLHLHWDRDDPDSEIPVVTKLDSTSGRGKRPDPLQPKNDGLS